MPNTNRCTSPPRNPLRRLRIACWAGCAAVLLGALGQAQPAEEDDLDPQAETEAQAAAEPELPRPAYRPLRQDEDWSALRAVDQEQGLGPLMRLKYWPLNEDGSAWLSIGGHVRSRLENWKNFNFGATGAAEADDTFLLTRATLHADLHLSERWRVFVEGRTAQSTERELPGGRRSLDLDPLDLQQGFVDGQFHFADGSLRTRVGRQMLSFGAQRLVSPLPWPNSPRSWDGIDVRWRTDDWDRHLLFTWFVPPDKTGFNETDWQERLWGWYIAGRPGGSHAGRESYLLVIEREDVSFNGTSGDEWRATLGVRNFGRFGDEMFDYDGEAAVQLGMVGTESVGAGMLAGEIGWTIPDTHGRPRLHLAADYASGDPSPGGSVGTFNPIYPFGHPYFGYIDAIGRQNLIALSGGARWRPMERLRLEVLQHFFWRARSEDAVYNAGGGVLIAGDDSEARYIGAELDLLADYQIGRHWNVALGWSRFFAGDVAKDAGPGRDISFLYLIATFTF